MTVGEDMETVAPMRWHLSPRTAGIDWWAPVSGWEVGYGLLSTGTTHSHHHTEVNEWNFIGMCLWSGGTNHLVEKHSSEQLHKHKHYCLDGGGCWARAGGPEDYKANLRTDRGHLCPQRTPRITEPRCANEGRTARFGSHMPQGRPTPFSLMQAVIAFCSNY